MEWWWIASNSAHIIPNCAILIHVEPCWTMLNHLKPFCLCSPLARLHAACRRMSRLFSCTNAWFRSAACSENAAVPHLCKEKGTKSCLFSSTIDLPVSNYKSSQHKWTIFSGQAPDPAWWSGLRMRSQALKNEDARLKKLWNHGRSNFWSLSKTIYVLNGACCAFSPFFFAIRFCDDCHCLLTNTPQLKHVHASWLELKATFNII